MPAMSSGACRGHLDSRSITRFLDSLVQESRIKSFSSLFRVWSGFSALFRVHSARLQVGVHSAQLQVRVHNAWVP
eukprot:1176704-Prorocentrum_minimum.AAC.3